MCLYVKHYLHDVRHIFPKAQGTSIKNVLSILHNFLVQFFITITECDAFCADFKIIIPDWMLKKCEIVKDPL